MILRWNMTNRIKNIITKKNNSKMLKTTTKKIRLVNLFLTKRIKSLYDIVSDSLLFFYIARILVQETYQQRHLVKYLYLAKKFIS